MVDLTVILDSAGTTEVKRQKSHDTNLHMETCEQRKISPHPLTMISRTNWMVLIML